MSQPAGLHARLVPVAVVAVSAVTLGGLVAWYLPYTVDDSYITFRYAQSLAAGQGPIYNPGLVPAEGYTSLLWMVAMAIPHLVGINAVAFSKACGIAATVGYVGLAGALSFRLATPRMARWAVYAAAMTVLVLAFGATTPIHAVSGMETATFALLLVAFVYLAALCLQEGCKGSRSVLVALCGLALGLTRPEGNLVVLVVAVLLVRLSGPDARKSLLRSGAAWYLLPGTLYFWWRATYYGHLLPLPFYLKAVNEGGLAGVPNVLSFLCHVGTRFGILFVLGLLYLDKRLVLVCCAALSLVVFFVVPAHIMGYDHRYLAPTIPLLAAIAGVGAAALMSFVDPWIRSSRRAQRMLGHAVMAGVCLLTAGGLLSDVPGSHRAAMQYANGLRNAHIALGRYLHSFSPGPERRPVIAIGDAGAVPYYSGWRTIDVYGLNEPTIALSGRHDPSYVLSLRPDVVVVVSRTQDEPLQAVLPRYQALYDECRRHGMTRERSIAFGTSYYLWLMAYADRPIGQFVRGFPVPEETGLRR